VPGRLATYSSAKGSVLEVIKADMEIPAGLFIFETPGADRSSSERSIPDCGSMPPAGAGEHA